MNRLRAKFTKWYVKHNWSFGYFQNKAYWICPAWVSPLLFLFSPSVYFAEILRKD